MGRVCPSQIGALIVCTAGLSFAQSPPARPEFEVASVKPSKSGDRGGNIAGSQYSLRGVTVNELVQEAYGVNYNAIIGRPGWFDSDAFDIVAKKPPEASKQTLALMMQALLASEFRLTVHAEQRPQEVLALVVARGGPKLKVAAGSGQVECRQSFENLVHFRCTDATMAELLENLRIRVPGGLLGGPLVDLTGIEGRFDVALDWVPPRFDPNTGKPVEGDGGIDVFVALTKQLGLTLEHRKVPQPAIVIDHVARWKENSDGH